MGYKYKSLWDTKRSQISLGYKEKDPNTICPPQTNLTTNSCRYEASTTINSVQYYQRLHAPSIGCQERNATTTIFKTPCKSLKKKSKEDRKEGKRRERGKRGKEGKEPQWW